MITTSPHPNPFNRKEEIRTLFELVFRKGIIQSNWVAQIFTLEEAKTAIEAIGSFNSFNPKRVYHHVESLWGDIKELYIGCEGSPVFYILLPYWLGQSPNGAKKLKPVDMEKIYEENPDLDLFELSDKIHKLQGDRKISDEDRELMTKKLIKQFIKLGATEVDLIEKPHNFPAPMNSIRIWWD
ncbi:unnamed protein product [marine sediment metagenome]|uniref:Uncharacterized protein n=1 Tax=marine sediment metagenome TaxID=412755 RepID=X1FK80_9ZZZZ